MLTIHLQHSIVFFYFKLVYLSSVVLVRPIIKNNQNYVYKVFADKIYHEPIHDQYLNRYTRIKSNHILSTRKSIDAHADEINKILQKIFF